MIVQLNNIQSIVNARYELGTNGIVQIVGENSNGKSILTKSVAAVATLKVLDKNVRKSLIRRGTDFGVIAIAENNKVLVTEIREEKKDCVMRLKRGEDGTVVVRTFRDGGLEDLLDEFGFSRFCNNSICLQIYETFGTMPYVNTSVTQNGEITESVISDSIAEKFLNNYKTITYPRAKEVKSTYDNKIDTLERARSAMVQYDWRAYTKLAEEIDELTKVMISLVPTEKVSIKVPKHVELFDFTCDAVPNVQTPKHIELLDIIEQVNKESVLDKCRSFVAAKNGYCPTCGRIIEEGCIHE